MLGAFAEVATTERRFMGQIKRSNRKGHEANMSHEKIVIDQPVVFDGKMLNRRSRADLAKSRAVPYEPFVSIHVACCNEPPELVIETIKKLREIDYPIDKYEILVIDNNTNDDALWLPVRDFCEKLHGVLFFHRRHLPGAKSGALNFSRRMMSEKAEVVCIMDCDYHVDPDWIKDYVRLLNSPFVGFVQMAQDYRDFDESPFKRLVYSYYIMPNKTAIPMRNEDDASFTFGPMGLIKARAIEDAGGWDEECITEDHSMGFQLHAAGYSGYYFPITKGRGVMPGNFEEMAKQRFRWCAGPLTMLRKRFNWYLPWDKSTLLTDAQKKWERSYVYLLLDDLLLAIMDNIAIFGSLLIPCVIKIPLEIYSVIALLWLRRVSNMTRMARLAGIEWRKIPGVFLVHNSLQSARIQAAISGLFGGSLKFIRCSKFKEEKTAYSMSELETTAGLCYLTIGGAMCAMSAPDELLFMVGGLALYRAYKCLSSFAVSLFK